MAAITSRLVRTGVAHVKANALDPIYQDFYVREHEFSDGEMFREYYLTTFSKYVTLPAAWLNSVRWDESPRGTNVRGK